MPRWYLVYTKPASERVAQAHLARQGYGVYLPQLARSVRRRGRPAIQRVAPLFPRYLFVLLSAEEQSLAPVRSSVGVAQVVRFGSDYAVVPENVIRSLRERADLQSGLHRLSSSRRLVPGSSVRITEGPFDGLGGVFEHAAGADRVVVLLRILGQDARVRVPAFAVAPECAA